MINNLLEQEIKDRELRLDIRDSSQSDTKLFDRRASRHVSGHKLGHAFRHVSGHVSGHVFTHMLISDSSQSDAKLSDRRASRHVCRSCRLAHASMRMPVPTYYSS